MQVQTRSAAETSSGTPTRAPSPSAAARATSASARAAPRETTTTSSMGRTTHIASRWAVAWTPAPNSTNRDASGRARRLVATPLTAAVRIAVSSVPSITASGRCDSTSNKT